MCCKQQCGPMQATVQATLANLPIDQVQSAYKPTDPAYAENMRWAEECLVTAVFCIIICGAWGTLSIRYLAPLLLEKARVTWQDRNMSLQRELSQRPELVNMNSSRDVHPPHSDHEAHLACYSYRTCAGDVADSFSLCGAQLSSSV